MINQRSKNDTSVNRRTEVWEDTQDLDEELRLFDFSHYPLPGKEKKTIRIFYNNINGVEINSAIEAVANNVKQKKTHEFVKDLDNFTKLEAFIKQINDWNIDISILAEPCVEWRHIIPRTIIQETSKKYDRFGHWIVATSECFSGSYVKPGGASIFSSGRVTGRMITKGTDPWGYGRWSYARYKGKSGKSLLIIGGYRVGHRSSVPGVCTAWYQQKVLITKDKRDGEPEELFLVDLEEWIDKNSDQQTEIILALDANEKWDTNSKIVEFSQRVGLVNLNIEGGYNFPASHPCVPNRSRDTTIDFCLCTPRVLESTTYATMTPYDLQSLGDHRGMLFDIDINSLLQSENMDTALKEVRKLNTGNPNTTKKYLDTIEQRFKEQNIFERANKLLYHRKRKKYTRWKIMKKYEKIDREVFTICQSAEKSCKPTVSGHYQWSPVLARAIKELAYWRARHKYMQENSTIIKLGEELGIEYEEKPLEEIHLQLRHSREHLQHIQSDSITFRQQHLESLADLYAANNNISRMNAVKELLSHESQRRMFSMLRQRLNRQSRSQLKNVWVAFNSAGEYTKDPSNKTILDKEQEVHKALLKRNQKHLAQAKNTPFATGILAQQLKWDGTGDMGADILSGDILNKAQFEETVQRYFECLQTSKMSQKLVQVKSEISLNEYKTFWKKKKEETATSPFGLHVGHYKAAIQREEILNVHRILLIIPFQTSMVPNRWKKTVQTMIEKDPGHPWIHRLRIIELFDAQVNAGFQIFIGRRMVWNAVKQKQLHPASFGSTPGKMAASALLQKILSIDQLKIERRAGGI